MRDVSLIGVGMTPVAEHWSGSLKTLASEAGNQALGDANIDQPNAIYIGNAYGCAFNGQTHLGAMIADYMGLRGIEAFTVEAGDASGGSALRAGYLAVASGNVETVLVIGVEKSTDIVDNMREDARSVSLDAEFEAFHGATLSALAALLMRRYMHEYQAPLDAFEGFSVNAHLNGSRNYHAMYRNPLRPGIFSKAPMIAVPVNLFDNAPDGDGAAAVVLTATETLNLKGSVRIAGSAISTDTLMLQDREDLLYFKAAQHATEKALCQAKISIDDLDLIELHDAFTIFTVLSLEAMGFADRGKGWELAQNGGMTVRLDGQIPISTFGGLKSRGNPAGATGVYQAVEAYLQIRQEAGENQVPGAKNALIQNMGGAASTVVTHVLTGVND